MKRQYRRALNWLWQQIERRGWAMRRFRNKGAVRDEGLFEGG